MILEMAVLNIKEGMSLEFEKSFERAAPILSGMKGHCSHELRKCLDREDQYLLLVHWETLEDHEVGFRQSEEYQEWKALLHHFYDPFPEVLHYA
ncbi:MAG: antibiotic biosynthesis monooxygenase [Bacteroidota bacterium]